MGKWSFLQWPQEWYQTEILKDITFLEIIPIALAICLWYHLFQKRKIAFHIDNLAVVAVLNTKSSKNVRVMTLLRFIVYWSMIGNFNIKAFHISSGNNCIADALSRGQFQKFKELAPEAETLSTVVPMEFWNLLKSSL